MMKSLAALVPILSSSLVGCGAAPAPQAVTPVVIADRAATPLPCAAAETPRMNLEVMHEVVMDVGTDVRRQGSVWEFTYGAIPLAIITDERADRMRIVSPVEHVANLTQAHLDAVLNGNFHSALDARYAASQGVLYSVFIHPLSTLHRDDLESGIRQTASLVQTFGTTYSSGELVFGGP